METNDRTNDFQLVNHKLVLVFGVFFGFIGVMSKIWGMAALGALLLIVGLANKGKWGKEKWWSQLSGAERRKPLIGLIVTGLVGLTAITISVALSN